MLAQSFFFPAATLYAALILPASILAMTGTAAAPSALASPSAHAHELLFGFALAVVAGHQLPAMPRRHLAVVAAAWLSARVAFIAAPDGAVAAGANAIFALSLALLATPRIFMAAKKWRNFALPAVVAALCAACIAAQWARFTGRAAILETILVASVLLFAMLLAFMGGRILAPAIAGHLQRRGIAPVERVQPAIEGALLVAMAVAIGASFAASLAPVQAIATLAAGILAALRLARWRPWRSRDRPDLRGLTAGYAWLALGLVAFGLAGIAGAQRIVALHLLAIGALGTMTFQVMAMTGMRRAHRDAIDGRIAAWGTALLAAATLARAAAAFGAAARAPLLLVAAACWSAAFLMLLAVLRPARLRR